MKYDPHLKEFVEESNALSGYFLNDSPYKPRNTAGYTWDDEEFIHHYDILCWIVSLARKDIVPPASEVNKRLMERFMDDEHYKYAGRLRRKDIASNRIIVPSSEVFNMYQKWEGASQRFAFANIHKRYDESTGNYIYPGCPYCQSVWLHKSFLYIRPFEDGNARTARMIWAAHAVVLGYYPLTVPRSKSLPMSSSTISEYDDEMIQFTRKVSLSKVEECLDKLLNSPIDCDYDEMNHETCLNNSLLISVDDKTVQCNYPVIQDDYTQYNTYKEGQFELPTQEVEQAEEENRPENSN